MKIVVFLKLFEEPEVSFACLFTVMGLLWFPGDCEWEELGLTFRGKKRPGLDGKPTVTSMIAQ